MPCGAHPAIDPGAPNVWGEDVLGQLGLGSNNGCGKVGREEMTATDPGAPEREEWGEK